MSFKDFVTFLTSWDVAIIPAIFVVVLLWGVVNWCCNAYAPSNKQLTKCAQSLVAYPKQWAQNARLLPAEYRRQWRACVFCGQNANVGGMFEFVALRQPKLLWRALALSSVAMALYVVVFALDTSQTQYLCCAVAYVLAVVLCAIVTRARNKQKEKRARKIFAAFVCQLVKSMHLVNATSWSGNSANNVKNAIDGLQKLNKGVVTQDVLVRAAQLLNDMGLNGNRTVEEQKRINVALNGLLQSYAKNAMQTVG